MTAPLSIGLLGFGFMGKIHAASIAKHSGAMLAGIFSDVKDQSEIEALGIPYLDDWKTLLDMPGLDGVVIATPTFIHAELAIASMERGLHVFLEKPMELTVEKCHAILNAAREHGVVLAMGHVLRHDPGYQAVKQAVDAGQVGEPRTVRCTRRGPAPGWGTWFFDETLSGGVVLDLSIHDIDVACWIAGKRPARVSAVGSTVVLGGKEVTGISHACLEFDPPGIEIAFAEASWVASPTYPFSTSIEVAGTGGLLACTQPGKHPLEVFPASGARVALNLHDADGYYNEIADFIVAIQQGRPPAVSGTDGLHAVETCLAALESIKTGKTITMEGWRP